jgi:hypothetical protein
MSETEVNIPILRKAVEWAEAEAAKPYELCAWDQENWVIPGTAEDAKAWGYNEPFVESIGKSAECGTCYCIAGFVLASTLGPTEYGVSREAQAQLGLADHQAEVIADVTIHVTDAADPVEAKMVAGYIPVIQFGSLAQVVNVQLNPDLMTRSEQAAWLRRLIAAAEDLADTLDVSAPDDVAAGARS